MLGWTEEQRDERLKYCVENRRFLMLADEPNLASQALSLSEGRLDEDGERLYGHGFLLAETFVDPSKGYSGTCYKAAGWSEAGITQGGRGPQKRSKKLYFIKELKKGALSKLKNPELCASDISNPRQEVLFLEQLNLVGLRKRLEVIKDYRSRPGNYPLSSLLALILGAVMGGMTNSAEITRWIDGVSLGVLKSLGCKGAPSTSSVWRALVNVDNAELEAAICPWLAEQADKVFVDRKIKILSLDGKALRGATNAAGVDLRILTLIESISATICKQVMIGEKTNEIPHGQILLAAVELDANTIVTADAMHTQKKTAEIIQKKTLTTSSRPRETKETSKKLSSSIPLKKIGRYQRALRTLTTDE